MAHRGYDSIEDKPIARKFQNWYQITISRRHPLSFPAWFLAAAVSMGLPELAAACIYVKSSVNSDSGRNSGCYQGFAEKTGRRFGGRLERGTGSGV
jgi:hypothetical protein